MVSIREEFTNINIQRTGRWYTQNIHIQNTKILQYFKSNLHRDDKGVYILNTFGSLQEKGYIKIYGPILFVVDMTSKDFILENNSLIPFEKSHLIMDDDGIPYLWLESLKAYASFNSNTVEKFSTLLEYSNDVFYWNDKPIPIYSSIPWNEQEPI